MKHFKLFLALMLAMIITAGCNSDKTVKNENTSVGNDEDNQVVSEAVLVKSTPLPDEVAEWTEVSRYTGDVDGDGTDEDVVLATSAEPDEDGTVMWNDGQDWALYVDDRDETYVLLNQYVQLGNVYFEVSDYYTADGAEPRINVIVSTGASFSMKSYSFSKKDMAYIENMVYDTSNETEAGINRRFSSIPEVK